jgi:acid phosphatase family membrane protein YuiD
MYPLENTIALGGVLIGIINAQLVAIATGIANNKGSISNPFAILKTIGIAMVVNATLLIISVRNKAKAVNIRSKSHKGMFWY